MRTCPTEVKKGALVRHDDDFGLRDTSDPWRAMVLDEQPLLCAPR